MRKTMLLVCMLGCGYGGDFGSSGGLGADPGGAQDIGYARDVIGRGGVPRADTITVEGLLSEHDLPTLPPPCAEAMCVRPALAVARSLETGRREYFIHMGMMAGIDAAAFRRPPLDVMVAIDKSASMSIDLAQTTSAVARLIDHLRDDDRIGVIAFDSSLHTVVPFGPPADRVAMRSAVQSLQAEGGWQLEPASGEAYRILTQAGAVPGRMRRVMIFSCAYPSPGTFDAQLMDGARQGICLSFLGVLLGYSPRLATLLGQTHGGAYYYLESLAKVVQVFDTDFDVMVTPLAYDLHFDVAPGTGFRLARLYGVPGDAEGAPRSGFDVATAFLSHRRGALVARLSVVAEIGAQTTQVGQVTLSYTPEPALGFAAAPPQVEPIVAPPGDGDWYGSEGVRKAVALVNQAQRMRAGCAAWASGDQEGARSIVHELVDYLRGEAQALATPDLDIEVRLVEKLLANMGG